MNKYLFVHIAFLFSLHLEAQQARVAGYVMDAASGERLIGASVYDPQRKKGAVSNEYGYFSMVTDGGSETRLRFSYVGYESLELGLFVQGDTVVSVGLKPRVMEEVTVRGERNIRRHSASAVRFSSPDLLEYPSMKPDIDILDVIQQQPGVQPGLEGSVGFSVRGGNNDQNLILMDNVPLYNTGHLAGFVSIFDPYAINSMTFYKGGFPARYGGRVSSVLDIYLREGDLKGYHGEANIGVFSGKMALEGPIVKDRSSFLVSYRRSTIDLFLRGVYAFQNPESRFLYNYHDINLKLNHRIDDRNHVYLSFYSGGDRLDTQGSRSFRATEETMRHYSNFYLNEWGNRFASLRWNRTFGKRLFYNATAAYSDFQYLLGAGDQIMDNEEVAFLNRFSHGVAVRDLVLKNDLDIVRSNNLAFKAGIHLTAHGFEPVKWRQRRVELGGFGQRESRNEVALSAFEGFAYVQSDVLLFGGKLSLHPGIRAGKYFLKGSKGFVLFEPRFRAGYRASERGRIELDYARMSQTVHSLNSSGTSLTPDIWIPVTERLKPAISDQVSVSYGMEYPEDGFNFQVGGFYKEMRNLIDYNRSTGFGTIKGDWDKEFAADGFGRAFGLEASADKQLDRVKVEGNYTLSRSVRRFGEINGGRYFPHHFDRPHNLVLSGLLRLNAKTTLSALWTYRTGQPMTLGLQTYRLTNNHRFSLSYYADQPENFLNQTPYPMFFEDGLLVDEVNNYRMPDYHRLDLALHHRKKWKNGWTRTVGVSIYNGYNRQNAYYIYTEKDGDGFSFRKLTLFPVLPTVSYGVKF